VKIKNNKIFFIAEAGVNHNGSMKNVIKMIDIASKSGADAIKFQTFKASNLATENAKKANYQLKTTNNKESHFNMLKRLELSEKDHFKIKNYCKRKRIIFLSTAFDFDSLNFLNKKIKLDTFKIPSGELNNLPLLIEFGRTKKKIILSTGMGTLKEIDKAISYLALGNILGRRSFDKNVLKKELKKLTTKKKLKILKNKVSILHCTTNYPAKNYELNLNAIKTIFKKFNLPVGYSDHSMGLQASLTACALGSKIIEKHFTISRKLKGPDHKASLEPGELKSLIKEINNIKISLGNGVKKPFNSEINNIKTVRKSLVAIADIKKNEIFSKQNIGLKRPGTGLSPSKYWQYIGRKAKKNFKKDNLIK
tara:strand:- start:3417 stop:4511 length:1095 start_codon:yes stop_codon:yes gene_type:complete